jgi:hypothetical protein
MPPAAPAARRLSQMNPTTSSSGGMIVKSSVSQNGVWFTGWAVTVTLCCSSSGSRSLSANAGRTVMKWVALSVLEGDAPTGFLVTPMIDSPVLVTLTTLLATTWALKTVYGMVTCFGWAGAKITLTMKKLIAKSTTSVAQNRQSRSESSMLGDFRGGRVGGLSAALGGGLLAMGLSSV